MKPEAKLQSMADQLLLQQYALLPYSSMAMAISCISAAGQASTWSRRPARPTGTSLQWPVKACRYELGGAFKKASGKKTQSPCRG